MSFLSVWIFERRAAGNYIYSTWGQARSQSSQVFLTTSPFSSTWVVKVVKVVKVVIIQLTKREYQHIFGSGHIICYKTRHIELHIQIQICKNENTNANRIQIQIETVSKPQWHTRLRHSHCQPECTLHRWFPEILNLGFFTANIFRS